MAATGEASHRVATCLRVPPQRPSTSSSQLWTTAVCPQCSHQPVQLCCSCSWGLLLNQGPCLMLSAAVAAAAARPQGAQEDGDDNPCVQRTPQHQRHQQQRCQHAVCHREENGRCAGHTSDQLASSVDRQASGVAFSSAGTVLHSGPETAAALAVAGVDILAARASPAPLLVLCLVVCLAHRC